MLDSVRVNFSEMLPLFPLPDTVLLPHAILPLHIFESRYRQMVAQCLDRSGQIAVATFEPRGRDALDDAPVPIRSATCIGQIIQHDALPQGRYNILLHGVCRARIKQMVEPDDDRYYRLVRVAPLDRAEDETPLEDVRERIRRLLAGHGLRRHLRGVETFLDWVERDDVTTPALLELIGFAMLHDTEVKYKLLAEPNVRERARIVTHELAHLEDLARTVDRQGAQEWPRGLSWN